MSKFALTTACAIFMLGMGLGHVTSVSSQDVAMQTMQGIDPSNLLANYRDLRDETVRDAI
ncbi:MAG TPA: hypothetical protein VFB45_06830 [Pseudolabrys sp.]|nr:hypothetical protein [Pseudolabrys sp.]